MDLDRPLPMLDVQPRPDQQAHDQRNRITEQIRPLPRLEPAADFHRPPLEVFGNERLQVEENHRHTDHDQAAHQRMAELDALDAELLAEQTSGRQHHENDHRQIDRRHRAGHQFKLPEQVFRQRENRQRERHDLIEVENQAERLGELVEKHRQGFLTAAVPFRHDLGEKPEQHQAQRIRNREQQQPLEPEHERHLNAEKQPQPPHPGQSHGIPPKQRVHPPEVHQWPKEPAIRHAGKPDSSEYQGRTRQITRHIRISHAAAPPRFRIL